MRIAEQVEPLRRAVAALRSRARALLALAGVSRVLALLPVGLAGHFCADYFFRLPIGARFFGIALLSFALLWIAVRHLVLPLLSPLDDARLAARIERAFPALRDRFASSLAFARAEEDPENFESRAMMRAVVGEAVEAARSLEIGAVAKPRAALRSAAAAAVLLLAAGVAAGSNPELFRIFLERNLLFRETSWPRRTTLEVLGMSPASPRAVTRGRDVTIQVRATGSVPDHVEFASWETGSSRRRPDILDLSPTPEDPSLFSLTIPLYASTSFTVAGGDDDRREVYLLEALTPPAILSIRMRCEFPDYLGRAAEELTGGDQKLPEGTRIRMLVAANMDIERAAIALGPGEPVPLERLEPRLFGFDHVVAADLRYSLRLTGANGRENDPGRDTFVLRMMKDQAPVIRIQTPPIRSERLAQGVVFVGFTARDDHRIESMRLLYSVAGGKERSLSAGEPVTEAARLQVSTRSTDDARTAVATLDLSLLLRDDGRALERGDAIRFRLEATDSAGRVETSPAAGSEMRIEIVGDEDVSRDLQNYQQALRESVERAKKLSLAADLDSSSLKDLLDAAPRGLAEELRGPVGRTQAAQARVTDELNGLAGQVFRIFNLHVFNRIEDRSTVDRMLPFFERHLLEPVEGAAAPFRSALYRDLWQARLDRTILAAGSLGKLLEMAELADRLATGPAPKAYRALAALLQAKEAAAAAESLAAARAAQEEVRAGLERLGRLMGEWQTYESVVRFFKQLKETQKSLVETTKEKPPEGR